MSIDWKLFKITYYGGVSHSTCPKVKQSLNWKQIHSHRNECRKKMIWENENISYCFFFHGNPSVTILGFCKIDDGYPYLQRHDKLNLLLKMLAAELPCILTQSNDCETCFTFKRVLVWKTNRKARYSLWFLLHAAFLFMGNGILFSWFSQHGNDRYREILRPDLHVLWLVLKTCSILQMCFNLCCTLSYL